MHKILRKLWVLTFVCILSQYAPVQAQIQVGDTLPFWSVTYIDWPPLWGAPQRQFDAVCVRSGQYCYVFSEVGIPQPSQWSLDTLVHRFDNHYIPQLTAKYGPIPDALDGDPHIFILWFNENDWGGYFDPGQQMPDSMVLATWNRHSCEHELIYHANWGSDISAPTVAHELGHLLHWGQDHSPEPPVNTVKYWEEAWVDEGFSTFAEMYLDEDINQQGVQEIAFFNYGSSDIPLIWFSDYNQVKLFMLYMYEHYGHWDYISTLISNQLNGIDGVESTLDILGQTDNFNDAFANWCVANYLDEPTYDDGKYWYSHYNFNGSPAVTSTYSSFPTGIKTGTLNAYAADYIRLQTSVAQPVQLHFTGESGKSFRVAVIQMQQSNPVPVQVIHLLPDVNNQVSWTDYTFGIDHNRVLFIPICVDSTVGEGMSAQYTYSVSPATGITDSEAVTTLELFPNPAKDQISIGALPFPGNSITVSILDVTGKIISVQQYINEIKEIDVRQINPGIYFIRLQGGKNTLIGRFIKE